eukprot:1031273-Pyramimonas_sp.AAC.1
MPGAPTVSVSKADVPSEDEVGTTGFLPRWGVHPQRMLHEQAAEHLPILATGILLRDTNEQQCTHSSSYNSPLAVCRNEVLGRNEACPFKFGDRGTPRPGA